MEGGRAELIEQAEQQGAAQHAAHPACRPPDGVGPVGGENGAAREAHPHDAGQAQQLPSEHRQADAHGHPELPAALFIGEGKGAEYRPEGALGVLPRWLW